MPNVFPDSTSETFNKVFAEEQVLRVVEKRSGVMACGGARSPTLKSLEDWAGQELGVSRN